MTINNYNKKVRILPGNSPRPGSSSFPLTNVPSGQGEGPFYPAWLAERTQPYHYQKEAFAKLHALERMALFAEQGLGKSKILIDIAAWKYKQRQITGVLLVTKKGVHAQWAEQQIPLHWPRRTVPVCTYLWEGKPIRFTSTEACEVFCINIDAVRSKKGQEVIKAFIEHHGLGEHCFAIVDESQVIKSPYAQRSKILRKLCEPVRYRAIATGTPITKNLVDLWAQFLFLDWRIIGHKYLTSFRSQYCITSPYNNAIILGHKNEEQLQRLIAPYTYTARKQDVLKELPPKLYEEQHFELSPEQRKAYNQMRDMLLVQLEEGSVDVPNALVSLLRLQEITCGYLRDEDGRVVARFKNPRLATLKDILEVIEGPVVIWCRFVTDAELVAQELGVKPYHGGLSTAERSTIVEDFLAGHQPYFVATMAAGGTGLNLQGKCSTVIYYSHTFNAGDRWQSEDRVHRIGTQEPVTYIDLIAHNTIDQRIIDVLRKKGKLATKTLEGIKELIR